MWRLRESALKDSLDLRFLIIIQLAWENYLEANIEISLLNIIAHMIIFIKDRHALPLYFLQGFWSNHLVDCEQDASAVKQRNLDRLDLNGLLQSNSVSVY